MIATNKRGERVLRPTGEAALGTTTARSTPPAGFVDDLRPEGTGISAVDRADPTTDDPGTPGQAEENMNMNVGLTGPGVTMNVNVTGPTITTTTTTTTTTTLNDPKPRYVAADREEEPTVYHMPGYSGPIGCDWPMSPGEFDQAKSSIDGKSFEDSKLTVAMQVAQGHCFTVEQVKRVMGAFSFEQTKLDFAKFAYDHTFDIGNYYKVNDAFTFESSMDELNEYLRSR